MTGTLKIATILDVIRTEYSRIQGDVIGHTRAAGLNPTNLGQALLAAIDNVSKTCAISEVAHG